MESPLRFDWEKLQNFCEMLFIRTGVNPEISRIVSDSLVQADLRGIESHGVVRTLIYHQRVESQMINHTKEVEVIQEDDATLLIDGNNNFGAYIGTQALNRAIDKARKRGVAIAGVKGSNHFGTGAFYALKAIEQDMILLVLSNASQTMPPSGGIRPFIGTNPLAIGVPAGTQLPFLLDMATSVVARGKIIVAAQKGEDIPPGWAIDKYGNPTTDANLALEGAVLPVGGPKGYAISMFIDILSGVLTGAGFGKYVNNMYENWEEPQNVGHFFLVIDINKFMPIDSFKTRMDTYISELKGEPTAPGVEEIMIPGEIEFKRALDRKENGIELPINVVTDLYKLGQRYDLDLYTALLNSKEVDLHVSE